MDSVPELPVLVGSGVTAENVGKFSKAHGLIIGSYFKEGGRWNNRLDARRIEKLLDARDQARTLP